MTRAAVRAGVDRDAAAAHAYSRAMRLASLWPGLLGVSLCACVVSEGTHPPNGVDTGSGSGGASGSASSGAGAGTPTSSGAGGTCSGAKDGTGIFSAPNPWTKDVSCSPAHPSSKAMMAALVAAGGWGTGATKLQIDLSLVVLHADAATPMAPFKKGKGYTVPDCDSPTTVPLPAVGSIEGVNGYQCSGGDCHLLILHPPSHTLYELYQANVAAGTVTATCAVVWDTTKSYPANLRGEQCTSADAAGFPMAAMLPDADEVATGEVLHAIRFALPNDRMATKVYVHPASHAGAPSGSASLPPYGVRLRLRADYPLGSLSKGAQVLARALMRFGMFLSDGGNVPLMVQDDKYTKAKWADVGLDSH